jgi:hypothetical protein
VCLLTFPSPFNQRRGSAYRNYSLFILHYSLFILYGVPLRGTPKPFGKFRQFIQVNNVRLKCGKGRKVVLVGRTGVACRYHETGWFAIGRNPENCRNFCANRAEKFHKSPSLAKKTKKTATLDNRLFSVL